MRGLWVRGGVAIGVGFVVAVGLLLMLVRLYGVASADAVSCDSSTTTTEGESACITTESVAADWTGTVLPALGGLVLVVTAPMAGVYLLAHFGNRAVDVG